MLMYRDMATLTKHDVGCIAMTCMFNLYIYIYRMGVKTTL